jgi:hypothetical protein
VYQKSAFGDVQQCGNSPHGFPENHIPRALDLLEDAFGEFLIASSTTG